MSSKSAENLIDTVDNWSIKYNNTIVARFNVTDQNLTLIVKAAAVKTGDELTITYSTDTPNQTGKSEIYIFDNRKQRITLTRRTDETNSLKLDLKNLLHTAGRYKYKDLQLFYFDKKSKTNRVVCKVIIK